MIVAHLTQLVGIDDACCWLLDQRRILDPGRRHDDVPTSFWVASETRVLASIRLEYLLTETATQAIPKRGVFCEYHTLAAEKLRLMESGHSEVSIM